MIAQVTVSQSSLVDQVDIAFYTHSGEERVYTRQLHAASLNRLATLVYNLAAFNQVAIRPFFFRAGWRAVVS